MNTILKNVVRFTGLVVGVPVSLPHKLNIHSGTPVKPQLGGTNVSGFTVSADVVNVTATRTAEATGGDVDVYVEHWHSIESVLPLGKLAGLTPFFFASGGGGGSALWPIEPYVGTVVPSKIYTIDAAAPFTQIQLPAASSFQNGESVVFKMINWQSGYGTAKVLRAGADLIDEFTYKYLCGQESTIVLVSNGVSRWQVAADKITQMNEALAEITVDTPTATPIGVTVGYGQMIDPSGYWGQINFECWITQLDNEENTPNWALNLTDNLAVVTEILTASGISEQTNAPTIIRGWVKFRFESPTQVGISAAMEQVKNGYASIVTIVPFSTFAINEGDPFQISLVITDAQAAYVMTSAAYQTCIPYPAQ